MNRLQKKKMIIPALGIAYGFCSVVFYIIWELGKITGYPVGYFTRDPASLLHFECYAGVLSNLGAILWSAAAGVALFSAALARERKLGLFLALAGAGTCFLLFDDLFLFHERIAPHFLNIPETELFSVYLAAAAACFLIFRKTVGKLNLKLLGLAVFWFGVSLLVDKSRVFGIERQPIHYLYEDGAKFVGIVTWLVFICSSSVRAIFPEPAA